jgi:hypothetical protein
MHNAVVHGQQEAVNPAAGYKGCAPLPSERQAWGCRGHPAALDAYGSGAARRSLPGFRYLRPETTG